MYVPNALANYNVSKRKKKLEQTKTNSRLLFPETETISMAVYLSGTFNFDS